MVSATATWAMLSHDVTRSGATSSEIRPPFSRQWYRVFPDEGLPAGVQAVVTGGRVYVGTLRGVLHALDADTGDDTWTFRADGAILHTCAVADGKVFFGAADGKVYAVDVASGELAWSFPTVLHPKARRLHFGRARDHVARRTTMTL